jgi:NitT/TauT family transport system substrate-binding protein
MIHRRSFNRSLLAAATALACPSIARAQKKTVIRHGNAAGIIDAQLAYLTIGLSPRLNFYAEEGVDMDIVNMSGAGQPLQALASGNVDVSAISPFALLSTFVKAPNLDVTSAYCWLRQPHWAVGVKPDSPIQSLKDLKGRKIGIRNQGDTGYLAARVMLQELGIDPDKDVEWIAISEGGPAGDAIYRGRVDAMAFWDAAFVRIAIAGFPLRYLKNTPSSDASFGNTYCVRRSTLAQNRKALIGYLRAHAKSTIFAATNLENAVRIQWELFPESKPKGRPEDQAMSEAKAIMQSRLDKWMPQPGQPDQRFGAQSQPQWEIQSRFAGTEGQIRDWPKVFTNDLLDEINAFDREAIVRQATSLKF